MAELRVRSSGGDYDVLVGPGTRSHLRGRLTGRLALVTDENVDRHWGATFSELLQPEARRVLPPGEAQKSLATAERLWRWLAQARFTRADTLVALGGGVVGDLAGFVAATYHRGMNLVLVPTTLLSQVDASIGGKTAVDLPEGKNLVGAFHPPRLVVSDTDLLATLPERERWNGLAELVKTALIGDAALFAELERELAPTPERIARAAGIKARLVSEDEHERGARQVLNFGHTLGHALESTAGFGPLLHGEAVVLGMRAATALSRAHAGLGAPEAERIQAVLDRFPLPRGLALDRDAVLAAAARDKKGTRFILLDAIGAPRVIEALDPAEVARALEPLLEALR